MPKGRPAHANGRHNGRRTPMRIGKTTGTKKATVRTPRPLAPAANTPNPGAGAEFGPWQLLDRYLLLGTEGGTFYVEDAGPQHATNLETLSLVSGQEVVARIVAIAAAGTSARPEALATALAVCASAPDLETRQAALAALAEVCRTGPQIYTFAEEAARRRGWGRALRRAVADWYAAADPTDVLIQALKHPAGSGWTHRDLLRVSHPKPPTDDHRRLFRWLVDGTVPDDAPMIDAAVRLATAEPDEAVRLFEESMVPWECLPERLVQDPRVMAALVRQMPISVLIERASDLEPTALEAAVESLSNEALVRRSRVHPVAVASAAQRAKPPLAAALDVAFRAACQAVARRERPTFLAVGQWDGDVAALVRALAATGSINWSEELARAKRLDEPAKVAKSLKRETVGLLVAFGESAEWLSLPVDRVVLVAPGPVANEDPSRLVVVGHGPLAFDAIQAFARL